MNPNEEQDWTTVKNKKSKNEKKMIATAKETPRISTNTNTPDPIVKETTTIAPGNIRLMAGRLGRNLKRTKEKYGVSISLPPRGDSQIILQGSVEMISAAKKDIEENLSNVTTFYIQKEYRWLVLGQEAKTVIALENFHQVDINICDDGKVQICGNSKKKCEAAKKAIQSMIGRWKTDYSYKKKFSVPAHLMSYIRGKNGWNLNNIETTYGVQIFLPSDTDGTEITIKGSSSNRISAAKEIIEASISCKKRFIIGKEYCHLVLGHRGEKIVSLSEKLNVSIDVQEDGRVDVTGKQRDDTEAAKKAIESMIEELKTAEVYQEKFTVPENVTGYVKGPNGSNIERIESTYRVHLFVPPAGDKPEISVKGSDAESVTAAKEHILETIGTTLEVKKRSVGHIIGPKGTVIRRLNEEYNVFIKFEDEVEGKPTRTAYILGAKKHATAARQAIIAIISP